MEIVVRTKKHYWHFGGWHLIRKVTSWDWDRIIQTVDALHAVQTEKLDLQLDKMRKNTDDLDAYVGRGAVKAPEAEIRGGPVATCTQASAWQAVDDMSLPFIQEPVGKTS
jgi:hypothetical protein